METELILPPDRIILPDIPFSACYGCLEWEKTTPQPFRLALTLWLSTRRAGTEDDLTATVDYGALYLQVREYALSHSFDLIETLAERIAALILTDPRIAQTQVLVEKCQARAGEASFPAQVCIRRRQA